MHMTRANQTKAETETKTENTEIVSVQERIAQRLANIDRSTQAPASQRISTKGIKFTLPDGKESQGPLNCVIVDYINTNSWYDKPYNENDIQPPTCHAIGRDLKKMKPGSNIKNPVATQCDGCPKNEFGSKGRGKECTNNVILALLPEGYDENSELFTLKVSPKGLGPWSTYVRTLSEQKIDPVQVVTSISFRSGVSYPSLLFTQIGGNESLNEVGKFLPQAETMLLNSTS